jgi:hypothetical protein
MDKIQWEIFVPIFKNRFILKGLALAVGIPFGILIAVILFTGGSDAPYALGLIGLLFILTFVIVMIVYGGKYAAGFILDEKGIVNYTQNQQLKRNRILNTALMIFGTISFRPATVGAAMIAQSRQVVRLPWKKVKKVVYYPRQHAILVRGGHSEKLIVFCSNANYSEAERMIMNNINSTVESQTK